jgi:hypothetical protein
MRKWLWRGPARELRAPEFSSLVADASRAQCAYCTMTETTVVAVWVPAVAVTVTE